jgi:hypothetical protein
MRIIDNFKTTRTPIVHSILWLTAAHMAVCALIFAQWRATDSDLFIEMFFNYQGSLFFVLCAAAETWLAWCALQQFSQGEPLKNAWLLIALASGYRLIGYIFSKILIGDTYLNPIYWLFGSQDQSFYSMLKNFGLFISGPLNMIVLAWGLFLMLRALRRLGFLFRLRTLDYLLISAVAAFTIRQIYEIIVWIQTPHATYDMAKALMWSSDPLLSILILEAIIIRRSAVETGYGLLAKSWTAFAVGIFLTSLGDIGLWATTNHYYIPWPYSSFTWCIWFLASAAYALGPAYQVEAYRRAFREAKVIAMGVPSSSLPE